MNPDEVILDAMNSRIEALEREDAAAERLWKERVAVATQEKQARDAELNRLRGARDLLSGKKSHPKKSKKRPAKAGEPPTTTQQEVRRIMVKLAANNPGIKQDELIEQTKAKLKELPGRDLRGYMRRVEEVLHDKSTQRQFTVNIDGTVSLLIGDYPHGVAAGATEEHEVKPAVDRFASTRITR
ncbi:hypothetical protein [Botrimarina hoheduenensis]|uniref:Uncharacterized protein n=1 Tax=Botrimarina hoheduenensis TaxID=2528000 RepID=A0A5C5VSY7_9BACT|nr:hypothetical protein [Botrimarina hoheduenensis]TWT41390.1 hypothetical protein Pla111_31040 [Botrimarina hoheduenensis]